MSRISTKAWFLVLIGIVYSGFVSANLWEDQMSLTLTVESFSTSDVDQFMISDWEAIQSYEPFEITSLDQTTLQVADACHALCDDQFDICVMSGEPIN